MNKSDRILVVKPLMNGLVSDAVLNQLLHSLHDHGYLFSGHIPSFLNRTFAKYQKLFSLLFGRVKVDQTLLFLHGDWKLHVPYIFMKSNFKILWTYDLWESAYDYYEDLIHRFKIKILFSSNLKSVEYFNAKRNLNCIAFWIPEGVNSIVYSNDKPLKLRSVDAIQFGRKWESYHNKIVHPLHNSGKKYIYETKSGHVIFDRESDFIAALGDSKISICVPANITHPEKAGSISTVTNRYFQSFSSKTVVLGIKPLEMDFLFDYDPIISINAEDPANQIIEIIEDISRYSALVEKNYSETLRNHQWKNRILLIEQFLENFRKI